jgi:hypothetical protein
MTVHVPRTAFFAPPAPTPTLTQRLLCLFRSFNAVFERALDEGCPDNIARCHGSECDECAAMRAIK